MDIHDLKIKKACLSFAVLLVCACCGLFTPLIAKNEDITSSTPASTPHKGEKIAAVITCHGEIDAGLYESIKRRGDEAIEKGADYLILEVQTYGGRVDSADSIGKYLVQELPEGIRTVAYVKTEAISAGSMISVSCQDIIMRKNTTIGCSAPIVMGDSEMGETEREKAESFVRATFSRAAEANGYPEALLKAMVSRRLEIWQLRNTKNEQMEYFEKSYLPNDPNTYDLANKKIICPEGELLTLTANKAKEFGIASAIVNDLDEALEYLEQKDGVAISKNVPRMETYWSEEMVRFLNSPAVSSLLILGILLGIYVELQAPGIGFPALLAVTCLVILVGSKYLMGLANWIEIAVVGIGIILLLVEIFVIPGFGVAGLSGILCIIGGLLAMWIKNAPNEFPWPDTQQAWSLFTDGLFSISVGFILFVFTAMLIAFNMDRLPFLKRFVLKTQKMTGDQGTSSSATSPVEKLKVDQIGVAVGPLRPAGKVRFDEYVADVVSDGAFIEKGQKVQVLEIQGNHIVVTAYSETS